jgi:hypothetical protein
MIHCRYSKKPESLSKKNFADFSKVSFRNAVERVRNKKEDGGMKRRSRKKFIQQIEAKGGKVRVCETHTEVVFNGRSRFIFSVRVDSSHQVLHGRFVRQCFRTDFAVVKSLELVGKPDVGLSFDSFIDALEFCAEWVQAKGVEYERS